MKKIFVCSPLRGQFTENIEKAKYYCHRVMELGHLPFAPHIYFTQFLDDSIENERVSGIAMGIEMLKLFDEVWVFGDRISEGMQAEIDMAKQLNMEIKYLNG